MNDISMFTFEKKNQVPSLDPSKWFSVLQAVMVCGHKGEIKVWVPTAL